MGSTNQELSGPDFAAGIGIDELSDGVALLGHANGEAVVMVRQGDEVFATGASCTHYGGPLAEGIVRDGTIRCPWHHACFDLKTGEPRAPALSPIPCYAVLRKGDKVLLGARREPPRRVLDAAKAPASVVVLGAGPAGAAAVEALRREGYEGPITLVADEPPGPVDRPNLSKDYLAGNAPEEWIALRTPEFYKEIAIEFILGDPAVRIDASARQIGLKSGKSLSYGALLLATGAEPRKLEIPGAELPHVHVLRTLAHSRAIIAGAEGKQRALVVGSSFIGLEAAASLKKRGLAVDVVGPEAVPLGRVLGENIGGRIQKLHEEHGVVFHLGRKPQKITPGGVLLDDGAELAAELVVVGVGVKPRTALAEAAGLRVDGGVIVDENLRTSDAHVYAAGDVARYPDPTTGELIRVEHFVHAERQGQAAARNLLGRVEPYRDAPFFWSAHYDQTLAYVGHASSWDQIDIKGSLERFDFAASFVKAGRICAVVTAGRDRVSLLAEALLGSGDQAGLAKVLA